MQLSHMKQKNPFEFGGDQSSFGVTKGQMLSTLKSASKDGISKRASLRDPLIINLL